MNIKLFNTAMAAGWAMATAGAMLVHVGAGLCFGGLMLIGLTLAGARIAGVFAGEKEGRD